MKRYPEKPRTKRINLVVPYSQHKLARKCGAYWDKTHKVWYTYAGSRAVRPLAAFMTPDTRAALGIA